MSDLEQKAIERLRAASDMSLRMYKQPLVITYSGGKDSDTLLHLAEVSGVPYEVLHSLTTADAPETVHHVLKTFARLEDKGIKCTVDKHRKEDGSYTTMWNLIPRKLMPPTRLVRYCCAELKEQGGKGRFIATGVRWAESTARQKSRGALEVIASRRENTVLLNNDNDEDRRLFETCTVKGKRVVNPIVDWRDEDVLDYCEAERIPMNPLYSCGYKRVGCIGCPMAGKSRERELAQYPKIAQAYKNAFARMLDERRRRGKHGSTANWNTGEDVYHWWLEDGVLPGQMGFDDMEDEQ